MSIVRLVQVATLLTLSLVFSFEATRERELANVVEALAESPKLVEHAPQNLPSGIDQASGDEGKAIGVVDSSTKVEKLLGTLTSDMDKANVDEHQLFQSVDDWSRAGPEVVAKNGAAVEDAAAQAVTDLEEQHERVVDSVSGVMRASAERDAPSKGVDARSLMQKSFTPAVSVAIAPLARAPFSMTEQELEVSATNSSHIDSHLQAGIHESETRGQQPEVSEVELSREKKVCFIFLASLLLVGAGAYVNKLINDYEDNASITAPPWYIDTSTMFEISSIVLVTWGSLGLVAFTQVILFNDPPRHLSVVESFYLSSQIITTVGYGDLTPSRPEGQFFLACYILMGVTMVAIIVAQLFDQAVTASSKRLTSSVNLVAGITETEDSDDSGSGPMVSNSLMKTMAYTKGHQPQHQYTLVRAVAIFFGAVFAGALFFHLWPGEDKTIWQAFYMSCVTLTTVGFGSIHPSTRGGYLFATFWMLIGVSCTANMICTLGDSMMKHRKELTSALMREDILKEMDADGSGKVDKLEFLKFDLVRKGICQKHDIEYTLALFDKLDSDGSGELDVEDLKLLSL